MKRLLFFITTAALLSACGTARQTWWPEKKIAPEVMKKDYTIYRSILEEAHPGLYWYTSKDSMDYYFDWGAAQLTDSLDEPGFRRVLMSVTAQIRCGHTSVRPSERFSRYTDTARIRRLFPLGLKLWDSAAVVTQNLLPRDSILTRGTRIRSINRVPIETISDTLFSFISSDGYNQTHKFQALSNRGYFGSLYSSVFGFSRQYEIGYVDSQGRSGTRVITPFYPGVDTSARKEAKPPPREPKPSRKERRNIRRSSVRLLKLDTVSSVAMMDLNSFSRGYGLKPFFRRSFRALKKNEIRYLVIDVRSNGGGSVANSTLLTRYISDHPFKIGDSLYAVTKRKTYGRYIENDFRNRLFMSFFAFKRKDGLYHFRYFEKHRFPPRKKNHFNGKVYILTGGNSYSATTLFASAVREQENVVLIGEETGGGAYGNNAWLIPDVVLPGTGLGFRLPLFRLVINKELPKNGRGVQPEIFVGPTVKDIREGKDYKLERTLSLIQEDKELKAAD